MVIGVVPEDLRGVGWTNVVGDEMRGVERSCVQPARGQAVTECKMVELNHIGLAVVAIEIGDVVETVGSCGVDEGIGTRSAYQSVTVRTAVEAIIAGIPEDRVLAGFAVESIISEQCRIENLIAFNPIIAGAAMDRVIAIKAA